MAQRRLINRSLGTSRKFMALNAAAGDLGDFAQALYQLLIPNADDHGRMSADAMTVKLSVFPSSPHSAEDFEAALIAMHDVGLIVRYEIAGDVYLEISKFRREQPGIKSVAKSRVPPPPYEMAEGGSKYPASQTEQREQLAGSCRKLPDSAGSRPIRTEQKRTEENTLTLIPEGSRAPKGDGVSVGDLFEIFFAAYPKPVEKPEARQAFLRLRPTRVQLDAMLKAIDQQKLSRKWTTEAGRYIPHPARWLRTRQWEDPSPPAEESVDEKNARTMRELEEETRRGTV